MSIIVAPVNTPEAWSERARSFTDPWDACGWSRESQQRRFDVVMDALMPRPYELLLDFGCGTGELSDRLDPEIAYVGFDWASGMIERAAELHTTRRFTAHHPPGCFDLVACVGCFNLPGGWSKERTWHTLRHLWDTTNCRALVVSLYAGVDENCLIYDEVECAHEAAAMSWRGCCERWRPNDLLLVIER